MLLHDLRLLLMHYQELYLENQVLARGLAWPVPRLRLGSLLDLQLCRGLTVEVAAALAQLSLAYAVDVTYPLGVAWPVKAAGTEAKPVATAMDLALALGIAIALGLGLGLGHGQGRGSCLGMGLQVWVFGGRHVVMV